MASSLARSSSRLLRAASLQSARPTCRPHKHVSRVGATRFVPQRTFIATPPRLAAQNPPAQSASLVVHPTEQDFETHDIQGEYIPPEEAELDITDRAAERLRTVAERENNPDAALRISVVSGGCHGYQYKIELTTKERWPDDYHFTHPTIKPSNIFVDSISLGLLKGSTVDFATELIGSTFRIVDNPQSKDAGCGCGVSWEPKFDL